MRRPKDQPRRIGRIERALRRKIAAAIRAGWPYAVTSVLLAAAVSYLHTPSWVAVLAGPAAIGADRARAHLGWYRKGGRFAARLRRRHEGVATWAELRRKAFNPKGGGIPICTVTRGQTR